MNIFQLISPINTANFVNHPKIKQNQGYITQHIDIDATCDDDFESIKRRKLSSKISSYKYNDSYLHPNITIANRAMTIEKPKYLKSVSKRIPVILQNPIQELTTDQERLYFLLHATADELNKYEPYKYFGCRTDGVYVYNFDTKMIYKIVSPDIANKYIDNIAMLNKIPVDANNVIPMSSIETYRNVWMNTAKYKPVDPNNIYMFDIKQSVIYQQEQQDSYNKTLADFRTMLSNELNNRGYNTYDFNEVAHDSYVTPPDSSDSTDFY